MKTTEIMKGHQVSKVLKDVLKDNKMEYLDIDFSKFKKISDTLAEMELDYKGKKKIKINLLIQKNTGISNQVFLTINILSGSCKGSYFFTTTETDLEKFPGSEEEPSFLTLHSLHPLNVILNSFKINVKNEDNSFLVQINNENKE